MEKAVRYHSVSIGADCAVAPFLLLILWIKVDSKGPVFFKQKRVGIHKTYFDILKFRTMRTDTPKDMPTHMLTNPEQYITKAGAFLRKTSLKNNGIMRQTEKVLFVY